MRLFLQLVSIALIVGCIAHLTGVGYWGFGEYNKDPKNLFNIVGFGGSIASIYGIFLALVQVWDTKIIARDARIAAENAETASEAAATASKSTSRELRNNYYRFSLLTARRLLSDIKMLVLSRNWPVVALRANDLGDYASQLAHVRDDNDESWIIIRAHLTSWASHFATGKRNRFLKYSEADWIELCIFISDKIDRECDPLE